LKTSQKVEEINQKVRPIGFNVIKLESENKKINIEELSKVNESLEKE
jgi:hypothetical protein